MTRAGLLSQAHVNSRGHAARERCATEPLPLPADCRIEVDLRVPSAELAEEDAGIAALFTKAQAIYREIGKELLDVPLTGGGSDGNFTAALGIPTLDGLGAIGDGAHAAHEHVDIGSLSWRAALLAGLLAAFE